MDGCMLMLLNWKSAKAVHNINYSLYKMVLIQNRHPVSSHSSGRKKKVFFPEIHSSQTWGGKKKRKRKSTQSQSKGLRHVLRTPPFMLSLMDDLVIVLIWSFTQVQTFGISKMWHQIVSVKSRLVNPFCKMEVNKKGITVKYCSQNTQFCLFSYSCCMYSTSAQVCILLL